MLDFGLAKLVERPAEDGHDVATGAGAGGQAATYSPTITTPAMTRMGLILGTAAYMSPEQAKGRPADRRSDIWAFGCVLFEMLTGKRAFDGEDVSDTLASVLKGQPDWNALPKEVPASVVALLRRCLDKARKRRIADVSTALFVIDEPSLAASAIAGPVQPTVRPAWQRAIPFGLGVVLVVATALLVWNIRPSHLPAGVTRFPVALPEGQVLMNRGGHVIAISPDGANIVYVANRQLYLRPLADMEARPIQGTAQDVETPFFSPDGRWVGFMVGAERKLKKIAITGGAAITVCDTLGSLHGAYWDSDDQIVFGQASRGIFRASANGGKPENIVAAKPGEFTHCPAPLPGGDVLLFTSAENNSSAGWDRARIVAQSLKSGERKVLIEGGRDARYLRRATSCMRSARRCWRSASTQRRFS